MAPDEQNQKSALIHHDGTRCQCKDGMNGTSRGHVGYLHDYSMPHQQGFNRDRARKETIVDRSCPLLLHVVLPISL